jgi:hypothetical protein
MAKFDPKKAKEDGKYTGIPPGEYLVVIRDWERKTSQKGAPYLKPKVQVIAGPAKNKTFRDLLMLNVYESAPAGYRVASLLEAVGHRDEIDLDDDAAMRDAILNRPFKARIKRSFRDEWVDNSIERYVVETTDEERALMDDWLANKPEEEPRSAPVDEDVPHRASYDDDIPF